LCRFGFGARERFGNFVRLDSMQQSGGALVSWVLTMRWENEPFVHNGWALPIITCFLYYVVVVRLLPLWMKDREPFHPHYSLMIWNFILMCYSMICFFFFGFLSVLSILDHGLEVVICDQKGVYWEGLRLFMIWVFLLSKFAELGDTVFVVLKKKEVIFLHWYHHVTVLMYCWHANMIHSSASILFGWMNSCVHMIMYYYYFRSSAGARLGWGELVTRLQLAQMFLGIAISVVWGYLTLVTDRACYATDVQSAVLTSVVMYGSYSALFIKFYVDRWRYGGRAKNPDEPRNGKGMHDTRPATKEKDT